MAYHGIQTTREDLGVRPISIVPQSTIGLVGTAPKAKVDGKFGDGTAIKYNEPLYITSRQEASDEDLGTDGTLYPALNAIFRQGQAPLQMVIIPEGTAQAAIAKEDFDSTTFSNETTQSGVDALSGAKWAVITVGAVKYLAFKTPSAGDVTLLGGLAVGRQITITESSSVVQTYTIQDDYDTAKKRIQINGDADTTGLTDGTGYELATVAVPEKNADDGTLANLTGTESEQSGIYALLAADPIPKILCLGAEVATTRPNGNANPAASALVEVAQKLRATAVVDGPNTTQSDVLAFADDFDSPSAYLVDPGVITADGEMPASPSVAGLIAVNDFENGFWTSPSNNVLQGVLGTKRTIGHGFVGSRADVLNRAHIATIIKDGGFVLHGNETLAVRDPGYRFLNVARTANAIEDSLIAEHKWALANNITVRYFEIVAQSVNTFLAKLTALGAITGGECYPDKAKNSVGTIKEGQVFFNVEWSGSYPAQTLNIALQLSDRFTAALLADGEVKYGVAEFSGRASNVERATFSNGEDGMATTITVECVSYKETFDGRLIYDIDLENGKFIVDGEDHWKPIQDGL